MWLTWTSLPCIVLHWKRLHEPLDYVPWTSLTLHCTSLHSNTLTTWLSWTSLPYIVLYCLVLHVPLAYPEHHYPSLCSCSLQCQAGRGGESRNGTIHFTVLQRTICTTLLTWISPPYIALPSTVLHVSLDYHDLNCPTLYIVQTLSYLSKWWKYYTAQ